MIDRLIHDAEVIALKGDSSRLKNRDLLNEGRTTAFGTPLPLWGGALAGPDAQRQSIQEHRDRYFG